VFNFDDPETGIDCCTQNLEKFCITVALDWFEALGRPEALLEDPGSPLRHEAKERLKSALSGAADPEAVNRSKVLLGVA
jgi:hypothetical protein